MAVISAIGVDAKKHGVEVGEIVKLTAEGRAWVDYAGNPIGAPVEALCALPAGDKLSGRLLPLKVTMIFEGGDPACPVVIGVVKTRFSTEENEAPKITLGDKVTNVKVDGKRIDFEAQEDIELKCGKSSLLLRKDGKVIIKGVQLQSRASGSNKIKGSSVAIN